METIRKKKICIIYLRLTDVRVKPTAFHQIRRIDWGSQEVVIPLEISQYVIDHRAIDTLPLQFDIACTHFLHNLRFKSFQTLLRTWQFRWRILGNGTLYIPEHVTCVLFFCFCFIFVFLFYAVSFPAVNHFSRRCIEFCRQKGITTGITCTIYIHVECILHQ